MVTDNQSPASLSSELQATHSPELEDMRELTDEELAEVQGAFIGPWFHHDFDDFFGFGGFNPWLFGEGYGYGYGLGGFWR